MRAASTSTALAVLSLGLATVFGPMSSAALSATLGAGSIDPTFGDDGTVVIEAELGSQANDAVALPDGRVIFGGGALGMFALAALTVDGARDHSFGGGIVYTAFDKATAAVATGLAIQPDGKIVAVGTLQSYPQPFRVGLARYLPNGAPDPTFGDRGRVDTSIGDTSPFPYGVGIQADGKIVVVGSDAADVLLLRYLPDGTPDLSFGSGGRVLTDLGGSEQGVDLAFEAEGKIVVAGSTNVDGGDFLLLRYGSDGRPDDTFGESGVVLTQFPTGASSASALEVQRDQRIVAVGGASGAGMVAARYEPEGSPDATFGTNGLFVGTGGGAASATALQPDGGLVLVGWVGSFPRSFALIRLDVTGHLDTHFGRDGLSFASFGTSYALATAVCTQPDGKLVVTGFVKSPRDYDFAAARFVGRP